MREDHKDFMAFAWEFVSSGLLFPKQGFNKAIMCTYNLSSSIKKNDLHYNYIMS